MSRVVTTNVTAINDKDPTTQELYSNQRLENYLHENQFIFETSEEKALRHKVIQNLHELLVDWSSNIGKTKNLSPDTYQNGGNIQLHIFGSTKLGVNTVDADIDLLCLAPNFITKNDFFLIFCNLLGELPNITMVTSIPDAYTPVIKFNMDNIAIDMIFVSLSKYSVVPSHIDLLDDSILDELDEQSVRSLNGVRVAEYITRLMPNFSTFCMALRAIKHWARQRGIYSNVLGYLGGVNYAILVAYICLLYPKACPAVLIHKFFMVYLRWPWPNPVLLTEIQDRPNSVSSSGSGRYLPVWNNRTNAKDATHIMPIITPTYPSMNSSYNVGPPQYRAIVEEIRRGHEILMKSTRNESPWPKLFEPVGTEFFEYYPAYVQVDIMAENPEDHRAWFGWVESRMRLLVLALERPPAIFSHPQANCFNRTVPRPSLPESTQALTQKSGHDSNAGASASQASASASAALSTQISSIIESTNSGDETQSSSLSRKNQPMKSMDARNYPIETLISSPTKAGMIPREPSPVDEAMEYTYISTFFIGLNFLNGEQAYDVTPYIEDVLFRIHNWSFRKKGMDLRISGLVPSAIPSFALQTKSEPSNVKSCTPRKQKFESKSDCDDNVKPSEEVDMKPRVMNDSHRSYDNRSNSNKQQGPMGGRSKDISRDNRSQNNSQAGAYNRLRANSQPNSQFASKSSREDIRMNKSYLAKNNNQAVSNQDAIICKDPINSGPNGSSIVDEAKLSIPLQDSDSLIYPKEGDSFLQRQRDTSSESSSDKVTANESADEDDFADRIVDSQAGRAYHQGAGMAPSIMAHSPTYTSARRPSNSSTTRNSDATSSSSYQSNQMQSRLTFQHISQLTHDQKQQQQQQQQQQPLQQQRHQQQLQQHQEYQQHVYMQSMYPHHLQTSQPPPIPQQHQLYYFSGQNNEFARSHPSHLSSLQYFDERKEENRNPKDRYRMSEMNMYNGSNMAATSSGNAPFQAPSNSSRTPNGNSSGYEMISFDQDQAGYNRSIPITINQSALGNDNSFGTNVNPFPVDFPLSMSPPRLNHIPTPYQFQFGDFSPLNVVMIPKPVVSVDHHYNPSHHTANGYENVIWSSAHPNQSHSYTRPHSANSYRAAVNSAGSSSSASARHHSDSDLGSAENMSNHYHGNRLTSSQLSNHSQQSNQSRNIYAPNAQGLRRPIEASPTKRSKSDN